MSLSVIPLLLVLSILQGVTPVGTIPCTEVQYIELSRLPDKPIEVCVSPHLLTGFSFEAPVSVDVQDELRFEEVTRGRTSLHVLPPKDLAAGERLRLSVTYLDGKSSEPFFLVLVGSSGQSTRQVKIFRTQRSHESLEEEIKLERMRGQLLRGELALLRQEFQKLQGERQDEPTLVGLISSRSMYPMGIKILRSEELYEPPGPADCSVQKWVCYRSKKRLAIEVALRCRAPEPWLAVTAEVRAGDDQVLDVMSLRQRAPISMGAVQWVIVESNISQDWHPTVMTLRLREMGAREVLLTGTLCP